MGNLAASFRAQHGNAPVVKRTRNSIHLDAGGGKRVALIRMDRLHYGPEAALEVDTAWQPSAGAWQYEMVQADYNVHSRNVFNAGNLLEWRIGDQWVIFDPQSLNWTNQDNSRQQIAIKQVVNAIVEDDVLRWPAAWGAGRHFSYQTAPERLTKVITIDSPANLPAPTVTGTVWLETEFSLSTSTGVDLYLDGVRWAKTNNVRVKTANRIEFRDAATGQTVFWYLDFPKAWDSAGEETIGEFEVRRQGAATALFITVRFPREWVDAAQFPIYIDPTLTLQPDAAGQDTFTNEASAATNYGNQATANIATATSGTRVGLLKFDLSSLTGDETVTAATLSLFQSAQYGDGYTATAHRILVANSGWTESGAIWRWSVGTTLWAGDTGGDGGSDAGCSVSGTDYSATSATCTWGGSAGTENQFSINTTEMETMIGANYGFAIRHPHTDSRTAYYTSDYSTDTSLRPKLVVEYTEGGGTDDLTATSIATGAPTLGTPAIGQVHGLTATGTATGAPTLSAPTIGQEHALTATGIATAAPVLGTPTAGEAAGTDDLTATGIATAAPVLGSPVIGQEHALSATGIATAAPTPGTPTIAQEHALTATGVSTAAPAIGTPTADETRIYARPLADAHAGAWTPDTGTDLYARVNEATPDDNGYIMSEESPSASPVVLQLSPLAGDVLHYRYGKTGDETINITVELREGYVSEASPGTLVQQWSHSDISDVIAQANQSVSGTITDPADLFVRIVAEAV